MEWLDALIMGIVQGLAEYLPISSSGQLEICHQVLNVDTTGAEALQFDIALHVATVLSTAKARVVEISGKDLPGGRAMIVVSVEVRNIDELNTIRSRLRMLPGVNSVRRGQQ